MLSFSSCSQQFRTPIFQPSDNQGFGPNGLAWNGRDLLIGDRDVVFSIDPKTGTFLTPDSLFTGDGEVSFTRYPVPLPKIVSISDMAWEGDSTASGYLWIADAYSKHLIRINVDNNRISKPIGEIKVPGDDSPTGIAYDGKNIWVSGSQKKKIYQLDLEDCKEVISGRLPVHECKVMNEFDSPLEVITGLAWDCKNLWILGTNTCKVTKSDCITNRLVKLDITSGKITQEANLPSYMARPSAVTWVDGTFWVADYNLNRVFKVTSTFSTSDKTVYTSEITANQQEVKPEVKQEQPVEQAGKVEILTVPELTLVPNPAADYFEYIVKDNDTLWDIVSKKFGASPMDWPKVWELNPDIKNPDLIYPGQHIKIPGYLKAQASKEDSLPDK